MRELPIEEARRIAIRRAGARRQRAAASSRPCAGSASSSSTRSRSVAPPQHLVLWSRLGPFDAAELERLLWQSGSSWSGDAFLYPSEDLPILRAFMRAERANRPADQRVAEGACGVPPLRPEGARASAGHSSRARSRITPARSERARWWGQRKMGLMLESLAARGEVAVVGRPRQAARLGSRRALVSRDRDAAARRRHGSSTTRSASARSACGSCAAGSSRIPKPRTARCPTRTTFLSPFDRLIHDRARTEALWGFHYRLEMYVPAAKREYGYYVLPILHGDRLVGRIEPVFDRREKAARQRRLVGARREAGRPGRAAREPRDLPRSREHRGVESRRDPPRGRGFRLPDRPAHGRRRRPPDVADGRLRRRPRRLPRRARRPPRPWPDSSGRVVSTHRRARCPGWDRRAGRRSGRPARDGGRGALIDQLCETDDEVFARSCEDFAGWSPWPLFPRIEAPVLIVAGEHEAETPRPRCLNVAGGRERDPAGARPRRRLGAQRSRPPACAPLSGRGARLD